MMARSKIDTGALRRAGALADPRALVAALGLDRGAVRQPRGVLICCPWHDDRSPSCSVRVAGDRTIAVHCFSCGASGDALALVAQVHGLDSAADFRAVAKLAAELAGRTDLAEETPSTAAPEGAEDAAYGAVWSFVLERCPFSRAPQVAGYVEARGIFADAEAAGLRAFPDDDADRNALVRELLVTFERSDLEASGALRHGRDALDWPDFSLLIPWRDRWGHVQCVQRRRLTDERPKYRTPAGRSPRAPFGVEHLADALRYCPTAEVIVAEGALDCLARRRLARHVGELAAVIGIYSASTAGAGLPLDLLEGRRVIIASDADEAGDQAAQRIRDALPDDADTVRERPAKATGAKDWAELAAREAWKAAS